MSTEQEQHQIFGRIVVGDFTFALPAEMLGQAMPIRALDPLPDVGAEVLGAINIRGRAIPVVDILKLCGLPDNTARNTAALEIRHDRQIMAMGIDKVLGLVKVHKEDIQIMSDSENVGGYKLLMEGDTQTILLDPQMFFTNDALPRANRRGGETRAGTNPKETEPHLTFLCGGIQYAIAVSKLFNTVPSQKLDAKELETAFFSGLLDYRDHAIPVVNTNSVFGLPQSSTTEDREVVVLHAADENLLGLAVDQILNIEYFPTNAIRPVADHVRRATPWLQALLDAHPAKERHKASKQTHVLILDVEAITSMPELEELARMSRKAPSQAEQVVAKDIQDISRTKERNLIFMAGDQFGAPISGIVSIVPPPEKLVPWETSVPGLTGFFFHENNMIPFVELAEFLGIPTFKGHAEPRVVICGNPETRCGFLVDQIVAVAKSDWHVDDGAVDPQEKAMMHVPSLAGGTLISRLDLTEQSRKLAALIS